MTIVGIDYSITSPAICVFKGDNFTLENCTFYSLSDHRIDDFPTFNFRLHQKQYLHDTERFRQIAEWACDCIRDGGTDLVGIEDYSMGSKGKVFNIAENCGMLKYTLWEQGHIFETVAPTVVKKFATGKGNSDKEKMYAQFVADTGFDLKHRIQPNRKLGAPTTDLIDAYYICKYFVDKQK